MTPRETSAGNRTESRVVLHLHDEIIRGYMEMALGTTIEEILMHAPEGLPPVCRIRREGSDAAEEVETAAAKAIFFVNKFDGDINRRDLHFYKMAPIIHGIWIRLEFLDGEVMEGIVYNTIHHIVNPGFFLRPTDPESNNNLVYVPKNQLKDYRVLGLRNL